MSVKKKTDKLGIFIKASLAMAVVLLFYLSRSSGYISTVPVIAAGAVIAFVTEFIVLMLLRGKNPVKRFIKVLVLFVVNISVFDVHTYCFTIRKDRANERFASNWSGYWFHDHQMRGAGRTGQHHLFLLRSTLFSHHPENTRAS